MTILSIGTLGLLWAMLDFELDIRGANLFVRPFHAVGLLIAVILTAALSSLIFRLPSSRRILSSIQSLIYIVILLVIWFFVLPLGDSVAVSWERSHKTAAEVGDTGFGWFYWDDSGMGNWPMRLGYLLRTSILLPFLPLLWFTFVYLVFRLRLVHRSPQP